MLHFLERFGRAIFYVLGGVNDGCLLQFTVRNAPKLILAPWASWAFWEDLLEALVAAHTAVSLRIYNEVCLMSFENHVFTEDL